MNSPAICSKSLPHLYRLRLRQRSKFMRRYPVEPQQPSIIKTPVESDATASQVVAKRAGSKRDIATLLGSKSSLREAILIREILGPPRGLQALDATL